MLVKTELSLFVFLESLRSSAGTSKYQLPLERVLAGCMVAYRTALSLLFPACPRRIGNKMYVLSAANPAQFHDTFSPLRRVAWWTFYVDLLQSFVPPSKRKLVFDEAPVSPFELEALDLSIVSVSYTHLTLPTMAVV